MSTEFEHPLTLIEDVNNFITFCSTLEGCDLSIDQLQKHSTNLNKYYPSSAQYGSKADIQWKNARNNLDTIF